MMPAQQAGTLLSLIGSLSRGTTYFRGKWRITEWIFHHWLKRSHYFEIIKLNRGITIRCELWDEVQNAIWAGGTHYEFKETRCIRKTLSPGSVFLDVGANIGYYSLLAASDFDGKIAVHSFEPISQTHQKFCENIQRNAIKCIAPNRLIVSDTCGRMTIHPGDSTNTGSASIGTKYEQSDAAQEVDSITLDAYCENQSLTKVDVIKIDVEGHEFAVLKGAKHILARDHPVLFVEVREELLRDANSSPQELYSFLTNLGYTAHSIDSSGQLKAITSPAEGTLIVFRHP